jgi:hypothetical protein
VIPTRRVKYLLRALKRSIKNPPKINEHHPTDVFKSGAKRDPSFTDSPGKEREAGHVHQPAEKN